MNILFISIILLIAIVWSLCALAAIGKGVCGIRRFRRAILIPAGMLGLIGVAGFFGAGLANSGALDWIGSYEWPIGYASGVVRTPDGKYVVPHTPTNRIQI